MDNYLSRMGKEKCLVAQRKCLAAGRKWFSTNRKCFVDNYFLLTGKEKCLEEKKSRGSARMADWPQMGTDING